MIRFTRFCSFAAVALGFVSSAVRAQVRTISPEARADSLRLGRSFGVVDGVVSDTNLAPLQGAFVTVLGTKIRVGTGPNGRFRIARVPPGEYLLIVKRVGYRPTSAVVDVVANDTARLSYTLENVVAALDPVTVTEKPGSLRMGEFLARRKLGFGQFMTIEQIQAVNAVYATEIFRRFQGMNVSPNRARQLTEYFALSGREGGNPQYGACPFAIVLDDVPLPTPFNLDLLPPPRDLGGIEVYTSAGTIPAKYSGFNRGCGVILIWTRESP